MKRLMSLLLTLCLLIPCLTAPALADTPKPIPTIDYDSIPEPREGLHHYLLLCSDQWTNKLVNTDGIVIVTLDTVTHRIMLTSIIRDALVERPDGVIGRINYIARNSGPEALCKVMLAASFSRASSYREPVKVTSMVTLGHTDLAPR